MNLFEMNTEEVKVMEMQAKEYSEGMKKFMSSFKPFINEHYTKVNEIHEKVLDRDKTIETFNITSEEYDIVLQLFRGQANVGLSVIKNLCKVDEEDDTLGFFGTTSNVQSPSKKQQQLIKKLVKERSITIDVETKGTSGDEVSQWIEIISGSKTPSTKQRFTVIDACVKNNVELPFDNLNSYTIKEFSNQIGNLFESINEFNKNVKVTDKELRQIIDYILCPDVDLGDLNIKRIIPLDETITKTVNGKEVEVQLKRKVSPKELMDQASSLTKDQAKKLMYSDDNKLKVYKWKKTLISPKRAKFIIDLQKRLESIHGAGFAKEQAVDSNGDTVLYGDNNTREFNPIAYASLDELDLYMIPNTLAEQLINELQSALKDKESIKMPKPRDNEFSLEELRPYNDNNSGDTVGKRIKKYNKETNSYYEMNETKVANDSFSLSALEFETLNNCIHRLYGAIGQRAEEEMLNYAMQLTEYKAGGTQVEQAKLELKDLIVTVAEETSFESALELVSDSEILKDIMLKA